ncbi:MAG: hypothetical protein GYA46_06815 [candidate division Zixibacteria bacterium]|nr:hypothetical protein [candidate division Zixibacteria bacterium]
MDDIGKTLYKSVLLLSVTTILLLSACGKPKNDITGEDETLDNTRPAAIVDLTVTAMTVDGASLQWRATGDDGDSGTAAAYDLRYLNHEITDINWDSAAQAQGLPAPGQAGSMDSFSVTGLLEDSTYSFAVKAVDEAGNWSNLSNVVQAVCFDDYAVTFADTAFERVIRFYVNKPTGDILRSDMLRFGRLSAGGQHISDLTGIEHCRNLTALLLWNNHVTDLTPLSGLIGLRVLNVGYNGLSDIAPLASLVHLDTLQLASNSIADLSALAGLDSLSELVLSTNLIWNTAPLAGKTTIRHLALDNNQVVFVNPLYNMTGLDRVRLFNNLIEDLLPLAYNPGLGTGDTIWLAGNPLSAVTTDSLVTVLRDRGVTILR